jgi:2-C-methyl-D-erythritol 2,4-cyclodiphosphate synthase
MKNFIPRIGIGFDIHAFNKQSTQNEMQHVMLCGIAVPHIKSIIAHSDGDVALHALTDAMLGSIAAGSIGIHFPPTDPKWKDKASIHFVKFAYDLIKEKGGIISNIDMTIICQTPKIMPHTMQMREYLSNELNLGIDKINIKAVTTEGLGALGRQEGIAVQAVCCVLMHDQESWIA